MSDLTGIAVIDWLSFTFDAWHADARIPEMMRTYLQVWMDEPLTGTVGNGLFGFEKSVSFSAMNENDLVNVAVIAWGGKNQKGRVYVSINGTGCSIIKDWHHCHRMLDAVEARITRADVAVDALNGEFTVEDAQSWYETGGFTAGGRRPLYKVEGDWLTVQGSGRTFYVGKRQNGKYCRVYEKGKQLGNRWSMWNRFEVEIHNVDREIPHDIVLNPSAYFAGTYPCAQPLVDVGAERIKTIMEESQISLARLKGYCKVAYGKLIHVVRLLHQDDETDLLDEFAVPGIPRRLEKTALTALNPGGSAPPLQEHEHG